MSAYKRCMDFSLALLAIIMLAPILIWIAIRVFQEMGSPVLFTQVRPGYQGKPFKMYKFRTMREAYGADGQPLADAERLTDFGKWLRSTSLDELPELFNILRGEMSLVGPRPLLMQYLPLYSLEQARRHDMLPGLTGLAQIKGRNALTWEAKFAYDVWYVDHWSLILDLGILFATVGKVLRREGINEANEATITVFKGSQHS